MSKTNRRSFLKYSALASGSLLLPNFLHGLGKADQLSVNGGKTLVIIQLSGGNDGLNTIVPFRNDLYYKARPKLGLKKDELINLSDEVGLHRNLKELAGLYDNGDVAIINSVGYPNPNRSHFKSLDIWQSASDANQTLTSGWLGRYLDAACNEHCMAPHAAVELDDTLSLVMKGKIRKGLAFHDPGNLHNLSTSPIIQKLGSNTLKDHDNPALEYLQKTLIETNQSVDYIYQHSKIYRSKKIYPDHQFGKRMKTIAELIGSGSETKVYYISLPGFDTHAYQKYFQGELLKVYSKAMSAFCEDLKMCNRFNDTVILTFSEFGRRVEQNASKGTDHGTANNIILAGGGLSAKGVLNEMPDLANLDQGDLIHKVDFRQVYATLLDKVLQVDSQKILGQRFEPINFLKS
ncbi:MAG TPA: DUF1501 domain-containing protein [Cytophagaceae bacterium]